jgi:hypothetical protein
MKNETRQDAYSRLVQARMGCLVDASPAYLIALRELLLAWVGDVDAEISKQTVEACEQGVTGFDDPDFEPYA